MAFSIASIGLSSQRLSIGTRITQSRTQVFGFKVVHFTTFRDSSPSIPKALQIIRTENDAVKKTIGSEEYNFMPKANRELRKIELSQGASCIEPIVETLLDPTFDGPGARLLIGSLTRLIPTRQSCFEHILDSRYPMWQSFLATASPQDAYPLEFKLAGEEARTMSIEIPDRVISCVGKNLQSKYPDVVIATLQSSVKIGDNRLTKMCMEHMTSEDTTIRNTAITSCAQLSALNTQTQQFFRNFLHSEASIEEKNMGFEAFMDVFPSEESRNIIEGIIQDPNLKELVQSQGFLNNILDLPREDLEKSREQLITRFDIPKLPESSLMRITRFNVLDQEIRSTAHAALNRSEALSQKNLRISRYGLLVHRASTYWVGHAGIFVSEDQVIDMTVGRGHDAVKQISFHKWKDGQDCWGIRKERENDGHPVNLNRAVAVAREIASWKTEYDTYHLHQKGKWNKPWSCRPKYWEADCVGFTEHTYEKAGGDPIPKNEESWPITPRQQRDHMTKVQNC